MWERAADAAGVPRFTLMGVLGGLAARGEHHDRAWELLGVERPASTWEPSDFYPDALPCLDALRSQGFLVGAVGNTPAETEELLRDARRPDRLVGALGGREARARVLRADRRGERRRRRRDRLRRRPRRQRHSPGDRRGHGRGPHPPRPLGPPLRRAAARDPDPLARGAAGGARCLSSGSASASTRTRFEDDVRARARRRRDRASARARRPLGRRRDRARAHRRGARRGGARRHRLALPVRRRALARRRLARPAPRCLRAGARSGLRARQRRLRADRRGAEDRAAPRGDAPPARRRARRRAATG